MTWPSWNTCKCACHDGAVSISDRIAAATACGTCFENHVQKYEKDPKFRREKFDKPEPFEPPRPADATGDGSFDNEDGG